jgi:nitrogen-specific signal transduction histidine kinase
MQAIGVLRESIQTGSDGEAETIWILRDLTEQKRVATEKEAARRSHALAEVATVLAHEIRNPLGSMELFTGLLSDASAHFRKRGNESRICALVCGRCPLR